MEAGGRTERGQAGWVYRRGRSECRNHNELAPPAAAPTLASAARGLQDRHTSFLRLNYYPLAHPAASAPAPAATAAPAASLLGINPHTDAGFLTILAQDAVPGLEVEAAGGGGWVLVDPIPGALTVNVGDQCQVISNGRFRAPPHRVRGPLPGAAAPRYSAAFFFNPRPDAEVAPLPCFVDAAHPPAYRPIRWGEFRAKRFAG